MNSIHVHTVTPNTHQSPPANSAVSANSVNVASKRDTKLKSVRGGEGTCTGGKKIQENVNIKKRKVY